MDARCFYCLSGIPIDGKTVFTSDHALKMDWIPEWIAIIGSGYIGLEFSDVYTALGSNVTFIEVCIPASVCHLAPRWHLRGWTGNTGGSTSEGHPGCRLWTT